MYQKKLDEMLEALKPMEADILRMRMGFFGQRPHTLAEIGNKYNLSGERMRVLQNQALRKLGLPTGRAFTRMLREALLKEEE